MVQRVKDKLIGGAIGTASSLVVALTLFFFAGFRTDAQAFKALVNSKVDKEQYKEDKAALEAASTAKWEAHDATELAKARTEKEFRDWMRQEFGELRKDVRVLINKE